jgi:hypothetical protein
MNKFLRNWRTTVAGLAIAVLAGLKATNNITPELYETIIGVLIASGLIAAADGNEPPKPPSLVISPNA